MAEAPLPPPSKLWDALVASAPEAVKYASHNPEQGPDSTIKHGTLSKRRSHFKDKLAPLHCLALMGRCDIIANMLRQYDNIEVNNTSFIKKWTPLMFAVQGGHLDVVKQLLDNGANVNYKSKDGSTALHLGVTLGCGVTVEKLLVYGAKVNMQDARGDSALHLCMGHVGTGTNRLGPCERHEMTSKLIQYGASACLMNNIGDTPLHVCLRYGHEVHLSKLLLSSPNADSSLKMANDTGHIPLQLSSDLSTTELLLMHGSPVDYQGPDGRTALHMLTSKPELVTLLIDHQADVNIRDKQGQTPLHLAVTDGNTSWQSICHLLMSMSDINVQDNHGDTPLHLTCYRAQTSSRNNSIIDLLINKGAKVDLQNSKGETALFVSLRCGHQKYAMQLLTAGASPDIQDKKGESSRSLDSRWVTKALTRRAENGSKSSKGKSHLLGTTASNLLAIVSAEEQKITKTAMPHGIASAKSHLVTDKKDSSNIVEKYKEQTRQPAAMRLKKPQSVTSGMLCGTDTNPSIIPLSVMAEESMVSTEEQLKHFKDHFATLCHEVSSFKELLEQAVDPAMSHGEFTGSSQTFKKASARSDIKNSNLPRCKQPNELSINQRPSYSPVCETAYQLPEDIQSLQSELNTLADVLQDVYQDEEGEM